MMTTRCVSILLYDLKHKFLLQQRTDDAPTNSSKWGFFGGSIEEKEEQLQAVKRETFEELQYTLKNPQLVHTCTHDFGGIVYVFMEKYDDTQTPVLHEGKSMGWFSVKDIKNLDMIPYQKDILLNVVGKLLNTR